MTRDCARSFTASEATRSTPPVMGSSRPSPLLPPRSAAHEPCRPTVREIGVEVRIGLHTGECEVAGEKLRGVAVHIGSRVAGKAHAGEVVVSQTVKDIATGTGFVFEDAGEHELKGIPDRWHLYRVVSR